MKIGLSAESTVDLTKEMIADMEVNIIPYSILLGDKDAYDGEITTDEIIESVNQAGVLPKTSAINEFTYKEYFSSLLAKGYDRVIHFTLSGEMSSSNRNAVNASNDFGGKVKVRAFGAGEKVGEALVIGDAQQMPVIQPRTLELGIGGGEAHGFHQMQVCAGGGAGAGDVAGVLGDLRFDKNDVQHVEKDLSSGVHIRGAYRAYWQ
jgi:hypothetical protein